MIILPFAALKWGEPLMPPSPQTFISTPVFGAEAGCARRPYRSCTRASALRRTFASTCSWTIESPSSHRRVTVECKAAAAYNRVFEAQALTYLRLSDLKLAIVINFGEVRGRQAIHRVVNGLEE
ncbi:GxxExxY protein [Sorangium sp. KYC3313]|uniref:GxxExxY protein n=1 Tax=Sorangium sp. KYC3313 TaxID=3449740 RepID=UPI003F8CE1AB